MIEYRIEVTASLEIIRILRRKFLKKDDNWHYTLEGDYIELRVLKRNLQLERYMWKHAWPFTYFNYKDNIDITRKYQKQFEKIFHGYSELAMKVKRKKGDDSEWGSDLYRVIERCIHLLFNINGLDQEKEARFLGFYGVVRGIMAGETKERLKSKKC